MHRSTRAAFFSNTQLCTRAKAHLIHVCLHKLYPQVFFEQEALRVLAKLNAVEIAPVDCTCITTHDFYSSSNRAVLHVTGYSLFIVFTLTHKYLSRIDIIGITI